MGKDVYDIDKSSMGYLDNNVDLENTVQVEKITDGVLGQMFLIFGQVLVARSSSQILFFKR